jgi:hypothetical protein
VVIAIPAPFPRRGGAAPRMRQMTKTLIMLEGERDAG